MNKYSDNMNINAEDELHDECGVFGAYDFDGGMTLHLLFITVYLHYSIGDRKAVVLL